jgi:hypothetical protein
MIASRTALVGLITFAGILATACEGDVEPSESTGDRITPQPDAGLGVLADGGAAPVNPSASDAGPLFPGMMPPPPDGGWPQVGDAALSPSGDAGSPITRSDGGTPDLSSCTPPPAGAKDTAVRAWRMLNELRLPAGAGCINMVPELNTSAQLHCDYRAMNAGNRSCTPDGHTQVEGCPGFTETSVGKREIKAGYPERLAYTEVSLSYGDKPEVSIPAWLVTPYHRIPMVDPWTTDMGWGGGPGCDVIDFGRGTVNVPNDTVVIFPYDGQTEVPVSFDGREAPQPPAPAGGWPSSYPVSIYARQISVTEHVLSKDGDPTPLVHTFLDAKSPGVGGTFGAYFTNTAMLYGAAFLPNTKYRVKMVGTYAGGPLNVEWTFTTGARKPFGF